jgi:hypothetical protein
MKYRIIRVYENDYDYNYEQLFLAKCSEEQINELLKEKELFEDLDYEEREEKYGFESKIDFVENYIMENFDVIETGLVEIDCY